MAETRAALRADLIERFRDPATVLDDDEFNTLALRVFARNYERVPPYQGYCRTHGLTPATVDHWSRIPAVPTTAFRELTLLADDVAAERVFRTSGTTRGAERRGAHHVADLELYRASLRSTFRRFVLPDDATLRPLSLVPPAASMPDSSLAFMVDDLVRTVGDRGEWFAEPDGIDFDAMDRAVEAAERDRTPVLLLGTSAAFIHWLDRLAEHGRVFALPRGSRLMDTGGFKGRGRSMSPHALRGLYRERLGLDADACVNEYGMTEMLSQRYDTTLRDSLADPGTAGENAGPADEDSRRRKQGPPWLRSLAVDPERLEPLPAGQQGVLRHVDLANVDSVAAIQTEDLGRVDGADLTLDGRLQGAPPRGCSDAMDRILENT